MSVPTKRKISGGEQDGIKKQRVDVVIGREWLLERVDNLESIISAYLVTSGTILRFHADAQQMQIGATTLARQAPLHLQERLLQLRGEYAWARAELESYMHQILTVPPPNPPPIPTVTKAIAPVSTSAPKLPSLPINAPTIKLKLPIPSQKPPPAIPSMPIVPVANPAPASTSLRAPNPAPQPKSISMPTPAVTKTQPNVSAAQRPVAPHKTSSQPPPNAYVAPTTQTPTTQQTTHSSPIIISSPPSAAVPRAKPKPRLLKVKPQASADAITSAAIPAPPTPSSLPMLSQAPIKLTLPAGRKSSPAKPPPSRIQTQQQSNQLPNPLDYTDSQIDSMPPEQAKAILAQIRASEASAKPSAPPAAARQAPIQQQKQQQPPFPDFASFDPSQWVPAPTLPHASNPARTQPSQNQQSASSSFNNNASSLDFLSSMFPSSNPPVASSGLVDFAGTNGATAGQGLGGGGAGGGMPGLDMSSFDGLLGDEPEGGWEALLATLGPSGA